MVDRREKWAPSQGDLAAHYEEHIGEVMPQGLVPPDIDLQWLDQLLFGTAAALEFCYRTQSDVDKFLAEAPEGYFAYGFWGQGIQSHAFYVQRVDPWCRVYLRLPYGGVYSDREADARDLHSTLLWLPSFLHDTRRQFLHLRLADSMGEGDIRIETLDSRTVVLDWRAHELAQELVTMEALLGSRSRINLCQTLLKEQNHARSA